MLTKTTERFARLQLAVFFVLALFAWVIWIPQAGYKLGLVESAVSLRSPLNALTVWSPGLAAILLTAFSSRRAGMRRLLGGLGRWRVGFRWYLVAVLFEPARWLLSVGIDRLLGSGYALGPMPVKMILGSGPGFMIVVAVIFTLPNAIGEEIGWRGFALPRLQARYSPIVATLFLGLFWGLWHIPAWIGQGLSTSVSSMLIRVGGLVATAFVFTWIYNSTRGSLMPVVLFHAAIAAKNYLFPSLPTHTDDVVLFIFVGVLVLTTRPAWLRLRETGADALAHEQAG